jgi:hypothetical protein
MAGKALILCIVAAGTFACAVRAEKIVPVPAPPPETLAEFWSEPHDLASRDLFLGPFGTELAPDPSASWTYVSRKKQGFLGLSSFSPGYTVKDASGRRWSVKLGDESQSEVTASRLVWALGFHQPPVYFLPSWRLSGSSAPGVKGRARFRPQDPRLEDVGNWSWHRNPFVGTPPWRGLIVMMAMLNNSDIKTGQNVVYELDPPRNGVRRWYVVRDLGHSLGETGKYLADRNDVAEFETEAFITGVENGRVRFNWSGWHTELLEHITPADVRWTCERLARLSDEQWRDAFRAGGYEPDVADRFIRRFKAKIAEGLALPTS